METLATSANKWPSKNNDRFQTGSPNTIDAVKLDEKLKQTVQLFGSATVFTLLWGNHSTNGLIITVS